MDKISLADYFSLVLREDVTDQDILKYSRIVKGEGGFDWSLAPDPDKVEITQDQIAAENAMKIGNGLCRSQRAKKFRKRQRKGDPSPILVSEGDSWFQFPFLVDEVIDHLQQDYLIWSVGAAGDTARNMVHSKQKKKKTEYMSALRSHKANVRGFLFSAAGNDIIGEDPDTEESALMSLLKFYSKEKENDPHSLIDFSVLGERIGFLKIAYSTVISNIRNEPEFANLPLFFHGYDYVFPYPWGEADQRDPSYAKNNQWLGTAFDARRFPHTPIRRDILIILIDALYDMLNGLAGDSKETKIWVVNCRGAMPKVADWNDEIHGTSDGFGKVAGRFHSVISAAL